MTRTHLPGYTRPSPGQRPGREEETLELAVPCRSRGCYAAAWKASGSCRNLPRSLPSAGEGQGASGKAAALCVTPALRLYFPTLPRPKWVSSFLSLSFPLLICKVDSVTLVLRVEIKQRIKMDTMTQRICKLSGPCPCRGISDADGWELRDPVPGRALSLSGGVRFPVSHSLTPNLFC